MHFHRELEEVVETKDFTAVSFLHRRRRIDHQENLPLALRLRLVYVITPHVHTMPPHEHRIRIRVLLHRGLQVLCQILLMRRILNDRDPQRIMVPQISLLVHASSKPFNLLEVVDLKDFAVLWHGLLQEQGDEDGPLGVRVDAAACAAAGEGGEEEGSAL